MDKLKFQKNLNIIAKLFNKMLKQNIHRNKTTKNEKGIQKNVFNFF